MINYFIIKCVLLFVLLLTAFQLTHTLTLKALKLVSPHKPVGPDDVHPRVMKACAQELASACDIFNPSPGSRNPFFQILHHHTSRYKVPGKLVHHTHTHISHMVSNIVDPHPFAYHPNSSVNDMVIT